MPEKQCPNFALADTSAVEQEGLRTGSETCPEKLTCQDRSALDAAPPLAQRADRECLTCAEPGTTPRLFPPESPPNLAPFTAPLKERVKSPTPTPPERRPQPRRRALPGPAGPERLGAPLQTSVRAPSQAPQRLGSPGRGFLLVRRPPLPSLVRGALGNEQPALWSAHSARIGGPSRSLLAAAPEGLGEPRRTLFWFLELLLEKPAEVDATEPRGRGEL